MQAYLGAFLRFGSKNIDAGYAWSDRTQNIAMKRYDSSDSIFQLSTALMAAIWGMIVLGAEKPQQKVANGNPERWTIVLASTLLVFSGYFHIKYSNLMIRVQLTAEAIASERPGGDGSLSGGEQFAFQDILDPMYNASYVGQVTCLIIAATLVALAIATNLWVSEYRAKSIGSGELSLEQGAEPQLQSQEKTMQDAE